MAEVKAGSGEDIDSLLKRFNKKVQQSGILAELRRCEHFEKPSVKRKRKRQPSGAAVPGRPNWPEDRPGYRLTS